MVAKKNLLSWHSKSESLRLALRPSPKEFIVNAKRTIHSDKGDTKFKHQVFEGDNLDVLKILQDRYSGKVNLAFVDPPYNSGKDFIINDSPTHDPPFWNSGVSHERWLEMMHPRLLLTHQLLNNDHGILIAAIDDKEFSHLRILLDEVFGEKNFMGVIIWKSLEGVKSNAHFTFNHTYLLMYAKDYAAFRKAQKPSFPQNPNQNPNHSARFPFESIWSDLSSSIDARNDLENSLNGIIPSQYVRYLNPKPFDLLTRLLTMYSLPQDSLVLDLFAGTGSLLMALLTYNERNSPNLNYIGIQYPLGLATLIKKTAIPGQPKLPITLSDLLYHRLLREFPKINSDLMKTIIFWK